MENPCAIATNKRGAPRNKIWHVFSSMELFLEENGKGKTGLAEHSLKSMFPIQILICDIFSIEEQILV